MRTATTKEKILNTFSDCLSDFLYYDRKEDDELPVGAIETALKNGEITALDLTAKLADELLLALKANTNDEAAG